MPREAADLPEEEPEPTGGIPKMNAVVVKKEKDRSCEIGNFNTFYTNLNNFSLLLRYNESSYEVLNEKLEDKPEQKQEDKPEEKQDAEIQKRERSNSKDKVKAKNAVDPRLLREQANIKNEMYTRLFGLKWK